MDNESFLQSVGINFDRTAGLLGLQTIWQKRLRLLIQSTPCALE